MCLRVDRSVPPQPRRAPGARQHPHRPDHLGGAPRPLQHAEAYRGLPRHRGLLHGPTTHRPLRDTRPPGMGEWVGRRRSQPWPFIRCRASCQWSSADLVHPSPCVLVSACQVTVGRGLGASNFDPRLYKAAVAAEPGQDADGKPCPAHLLGSTREIEDLRPKTPPPPGGGGSRRDQHCHALSQSPAPPAGRSGLSLSRRPSGRDEQQRQESGGYRPRAYSRSSASDLRTPVGMGRSSDPYSPDDDQQPTPSAASSSSSSRMHYKDGRGRMRGSREGGGGERYERRRRRSQTPSPPPSRRSPPPHHNRRSRGKWADEEEERQEWRPRDDHEWRGGSSSSRGRRDEEAPRTGSSNSTRRRGLPSFSP